MTIPPRAACPFCALRLQGSPSQCPRCGALLGAAADDLKRFGERGRELLQTRRALSDTLFLAGLLLGGPLITVGDHFRLGSFVVLAASAAALLRRRTSWSLPGVVAIGSLAALVLAALVVEPAHHAVDESRAGEDARRAFVDALDQADDDASVEERGVGALVVWFVVPDGQAGECGDYPPTEVRAHLADLGFRRVVVMDRSPAGGLCSFVP
ncbi:MAG TPA: hypothetical protein VLH75_17155 [Longimicrobiales bacterium]|nr:hypothetical protein [Longimicrobiales bacterium]